MLRLPQAGRSTMADAVSHDQHFKNLIVEYPRDALAFFAPEEAPASLALGTERHRYLVFDYVACKLAAMPAERWLDSGNLVARVNLPNMDSGALDRVDVYASAVRGLLDLEKDRAKQAKYLDFIDIYAELTDNDKRRYRRRYPEEADIVTGFLQRARDEGREQGIEQGIEQGMRQGRAEGERAVLERQLRRRFGRLPAKTVELLQSAPEADLEAWADKVLDARTLNEVFGNRR